MIVYDGAGINTRLTVQWNCDHVIALILTVGGQISFFCIRLVLRSSDPGPGEGESIKRRKYGVEGVRERER